MFVWNPDRNLFILPYLNHPVTWYGLFFATGFLAGYFLMRRIFARYLADPTKEEAEVDLKAVQLTDRLAFLVIIGGLVGARLGHVFFYDWGYYKTQPLSILKVWEGGLASHGGAIGILIALLIFLALSKKTFPKFTFLTVLDALVTPVAFAGGCIRVGNFFNQEITGIPTSLPWGVTFLHPLDGLPGVSVHPVQLYEAFFYFLTFGILYTLWRRTADRIGSGLLSGWFLLLVFGFRFVAEFFKMPQNITFDVQGLLTMGQWLSLPFIFLGFLLLVRAYVTKKS